MLVAIHTIITFFLPVPGCPKGYLGPGGLYNGSSNVNCTGGAAGYIDRLVFGKNHMYSGTAKPIYESLPFDPEGEIPKSLLWFKFNSYFNSSCVFL